MRRLLAQLLLLISLITITPGWCGALEVTLQRIDGNGTGESIGSITAQDTDQGLVIYPDLSGLTPGEHGFHLHSVGSCDAGETEDGIAVAGLAAGGHWDPDGSGQHLGPFGNGHRGDLSKLIVDDDGNTNTSVVAPRLSTADAAHALASIELAMGKEAAHERIEEGPPLVFTITAYQHMLHK